MEIEEQAGAQLAARGLTLATAESCTGGLLAQRITDIPGSSAYFVGGFVTYADRAKRILLGVRRETLLAHGAVSEETAREMAQGARRRLGADLAVSITGIAGPAGGTPEKPVGLVYVGLAGPEGEWVRRHIWQQQEGDGSRRANRERSARAALQLVLDYVQGRTGEGEL